MELDALMMLPALFCHESGNRMKLEKVDPLTRLYITHPKKVQKPMLASVNKQK
jgi:hypothetical protein